MNDLGSPANSSHHRLDGRTPGRLDGWTPTDGQSMNMENEGNEHYRNYQSPKVFACPETHRTANWNVIPVLPVVVAFAAVGRFKTHAGQFDSLASHH